jgi:hypothetical protein
MRCIALLAAVLAFTAGCGDSEPTLVGPTDGPCAAKIDECLIDQQTSVLEGETARCEACAAGQYAAKSGACEPITGEPLSHDFPENTTAAGGESIGICRSWTLNNSEPLWVNAVELQQDEASHHSNWTFVPDTEFDGPDGIWNCTDRNYSQLTAALAGGVLYAQSTQARHEVQKFPDGVAVQLPANVRIISDVHTLNTSPEEVTGHITLTIYTLPQSQVSVQLQPFHLTYDTLDIPPQSESRFQGECDLATQAKDISGPLDLQVYYLLPHTHALGTRMFVEVFGGPRDGETMVDVRGFNGEPRGRAYDPPIDMTGATGMRFGCEFTNPRDETVHWGFDDQEMCEALGFAASPVLFESRISAANPTTGDDMPTFTGDCATLMLPAD